MKGIFFENIKFVFLSNRIWTNPRIVRIGVKKIIYLNPKNFINIKSNTMDNGSPKNIQIMLISAKYLYSIFIINCSKLSLYLRINANK